MKTTSQVKNVPWSPERSQQHQLQLLKSWNAAHTTGTPVGYFRVKPPRTAEDVVTTRTVSEAWLMGGHTAVLQVKGIVGGVALTHCMPLDCEENRQRFTDYVNSLGLKFEEPLPG